MSARTPSPAASSARPAPPLPANERFKRTAAAWTWLGLIAATVLHFLVFAAWPTLTAEVPVRAMKAPVEVVPNPHTPLPEPPPLPPRPPAPVVGDVADDVAPPPDWAYLRRETPPLAPPPPDESERRRLPFTAYTTGPLLTNAREVARLLERAYPPALRDAGVGGRVILYVHLSERGEVLEARVGESSGLARLDEAALGVVPALRFTPALNRDRAVAVWISLPLAFESRDGGGTGDDLAARAGSEDSPIG